VNFRETETGLLVPDDALSGVCRECGCTDEGAACWDMINARHVPMMVEVFCPPIDPSGEVGVDQYGHGYSYSGFEIRSSSVAMTCDEIHELLDEEIWR